MSDEALIRRFFAVLVECAVDDLDAILEPACEDRNPAPLQPPGRVGVAYKFELHRACYPAARTTIDGMAHEPGGALRVAWRTILRPGEVAQRYVGRFTIRAGRVAGFEVEHVGAA